MELKARLKKLEKGIDGPTLEGQVDLLNYMIKAKAGVFGDTPCKHVSTKDMGHQRVDERLVIDIKCNGCGLHWYYLMDGTLYSTWQLDLVQLRNELVSASKESHA